VCSCAISILASVAFRCRAASQLFVGETKVTLTVGFGQTWVVVEHDEFRGSVGNWRRLGLLRMPTDAVMRECDMLNVSLAARHVTGGAVIRRILLQSFFGRQ